MSKKVSISIIKKYTYFFIDELKTSLTVSQIVYAKKLDTKYFKKFLRHTYTHVYQTNKGVNVRRAISQSGSLCRLVGLGKTCLIGERQLGLNPAQTATSVSSTSLHLKVLSRHFVSFQRARLICLQTFLSNDKVSSEPRSSRSSLLDGKPPQPSAHVSR